MITAVIIQIINVALYAQQTLNNPASLNIDFKNRGYFYAASAPLVSTVGYGGWGGSDNLYQALEEHPNMQKINLSFM